MDGWEMDTLGRLSAPALGIIGSVAAGFWFDRYRGAALLPVLGKTLLGGLLAARSAFVVQHWDSYRAEPLAMLAVADGGFSAMAGLFAALVLGAELTRKRVAARRPLLVAVAAGLAIWVVATLAALDFAPARIAVPSIEVQGLDGTAVPLHALKGKPLVLNLWATWCPPCRREMPVLREAQRRHADVTFAFVNQGESIASIQAYLDQERLRLANVFADPGSALARGTASAGYPTTLFFDSQGVLFLRHTGELNEVSLEQRLSMLKKARQQ